MSHHKFTNLRELFQVYLNNELMEGITSKDFMDLECNCNQATTVNGNCICGGNYRKSIVICGATCKENHQSGLQLMAQPHGSSVSVTSSKIELALD